MKNKKIYICLIIIVILIGLFIVGIKFREKMSNNVKQSNEIDVKVEDRLYKSPYNFIEQYSEAKVRYVNNIKGKDYLFIINIGIFR